MLINNLSRSKKLAVLSRQQLHLVLEHAGHKPGENITLQKALEIARQTHAEVVVLGSFARLGESVRIDLQLYDGRNGELLSTESLVAEMTNNLEAYRYYSLALEKAQGLDNTTAVELLKKAIALDSEFAMAHARIGYVYAITWGQAAKAKPYLESGRLDEAIAEYERILKLNPNYPLAHYHLAQAFERKGQSDRAIAEYKEFLRIWSAADPDIPEITLAKERLNQLQS